MRPTLRDGQLLLVNPNAYAVDLNRVLNFLPGVDLADARVLHVFGSPQRGDVVVFDPPVHVDEPYIKRVIGQPGKRSTIEGGSVYIDGARLDEPYLHDPDTGRAVPTPCGRPDVCRITLGAGQIFVLGDNRSGSSDSREFGPVEVEDIIGKAWLAYWPVDAIGPVPQAGDACGRGLSCQGLALVPSSTAPSAPRVDPDRAVACRVPP